MQSIRGLVSRVGALTLGSLAITSSIALRSAPVMAQAAYGSYVGVGGSLGLTEAENQDREGGVVIAARYKLLRLPVSLRAQVIFNGNGSAVVPTISYDLPLNFQTDAYVGAGGAFVNGDTPVGDKSSFAIQPGIDFSIPDSKLVVFGNAIIAFDAYERDDKTAVSVQGGVGWRF